MVKTSKSDYVFEKDEKILCFHGAFMYEAKILDLKPVDPKDKKSAFTYLVHYKGWKNTWDDWVPEERVRKLNEENKELAANLTRDYKRALKEAAAAKKPPPPALTSKRKSLLGSDVASFRDSEERASSTQALPRGTKRARDTEIEKEEHFITRPSVRIPLPDHLKGLLVDDWENITKSLQLVPLPHPHPVSEILAEYRVHEGERRRPGSVDADILDEVCQGVREYFDRSLGRILLYRFERQQYLEVHDQMRVSADPKAHARRAAAAAVGTADTSSGGASDDTHSLAGKSPSDVYGAEHLCRLFCSMPELVAQTNMDAQSVARLREELAKMTAWLGRQTARFFVRTYVNAGQEYIERAKGTG